MKPLEEMTDQELVDHIRALHQARIDLVRDELDAYREEYRRPRPRYRRDPDELDRHEYIEEMSLGGKIYKP